ncbi:DNA gyrase subunit A [Clostridia bacterium]|nr:DNA gyrase subunit A [Clostridia bacterium]
MAASNVTEQKITDTLELNYMPYAMSVIVSRAIPEIDGFKPAHRKLLYTMYKMGLLTGGRIKSADVVGQTMRLNPHGDGAIYETLVRLTRGNAALLHPFIDSKGNFGKQYSRDMAYAASRYTEVKLDAMCGEIFCDIDKNTVDFIDNYNSTMKEPVLFPTRFPNLLVTPNQGIAVGMASNVASFNLTEVCSLTAAYIKNPDCDIKKYLPAPDFSTGGQILYNDKDIDNIYENGRGGVRIRAKYRYDEKNSLIEVYEIPYTTTIEAIIDKIVILVKSGKLRDINDVRDETDLKGLKITIDIRKNANPQHVMHRLFASTPLSDTFSCNFNFLIGGKPRTMGIREILAEWVKFRTGVVSKTVAYDLAKKEERLHLLVGLAKILLDIDKAISIVRNTTEESRVIPNLMKGFGIDEIQADFVAEIKLRNLNKQYILKQVNERENLEKEVAELRDILANPAKINEIIIKQLKEISKKYGKPRLTEIVTDEEIVEIPDDDLIQDYPLKIFFTKHNYFKKIPLTSLRSFSEQNLKEDDSVLSEIETTNKSDIIFFSTKQNAYKLRAHEIADSKASSMGDYLPNLLSLAEDEQICFVTATTDYSGILIFVFDNGKIAKIPLSSYQTKMNRKKLVNAYTDKANLVFIDFAGEDCDLVAIRDNDKAVLFNTSLAEQKATRNSIGVQAVSFKKNSVLTGCTRRENFICGDAEYYRADKIPSAGHFISDADKRANKIPRDV